MIDSVILATIFAYLITAIWQMIEVKLYGRTIETEVDTIIICIVWICLYMVSVVIREL